MIRDKAILLGSAKLAYTHGNQRQFTVNKEEELQIFLAHFQHLEIPVSSITSLGSVFEENNRYPFSLHFLKNVGKSIYRTHFSGLNSPQGVNRLNINNYRARNLMRECFGFEFANGRTDLHYFAALVKKNPRITFIPIPISSLSE